jgi:hypothetical protein
MCWCLRQVMRLVLNMGEYNTKIQKKQKEKKKSSIMNFGQKRGGEKEDSSQSLHEICLHEPTQRG